MGDGREDERATFQFIEEIQNCPDLWDVSSAAYKDTKNKQKKMEELVCVVAWREFDVWTHEFANFFKFAKPSLQT